MTPAETPRDRAAIERDVARTRTELGETVAALGQRFDVKTRARTALGEATAVIRTRVGAHPEYVAAGGAVALTGFVVFVVRRVRR